MSRRDRSAKSLRRRPPSISPRETVLIVCEGAKTEPQYFKALRQGLRLRTVEVVVEGEECGSSPISVVDHAIALRQEREIEARQSPSVVAYDVIWCVMDVEAPKPHVSLAQAVDKAKANGLRVALSNPMFEYWYLLHFERTSALMQRNKDVMRKLKKHHPKYKKNDPNFFGVVYPLTARAIKNSKAVLKEKHCGDDLQSCNPSTHVHHVVEQLQSVAAKPLCGAGKNQREV